MIVKITPRNTVSPLANRLDTNRLDTVTRRAERLLTECGYRPLCAISCTFQEGTLTLRGRVPTYYMKQVAQTLVAKLDEVHRIDNRLEVLP